MAEAPPQTGFRSGYGPGFLCKFRSHSAILPSGRTSSLRSLQFPALQKFYTFCTGLSTARLQPVQDSPSFPVDITSVFPRPLMSEKEYPFTVTNDDKKFRCVLSKCSSLQRGSSRTAGTWGRCGRRRGMSAGRRSNPGIPPPGRPASLRCRSGWRHWRR